MSFFTRAELIYSAKADDLGIDNTPPFNLLIRLDWTIAGANRIRNFLGHPMIVSSGYRSDVLNRAVGGVDKIDEVTGKPKISQHRKCEALDFVCPGFGTPAQVYDALVPMIKVLGIDQLILESYGGKVWIHASFTADPRHEFFTQIG